LFFRFCSFVFISLLLAPLLAGAEPSSEPAKLRNANRDKTPDGLYLSSDLDTTMGTLVSGLSAEAIGEFFAQHPELKPRLVMIDRRTNRHLTKAEDINRSYEEGHLDFAIERPVLFAVGVPRSASKQRKLKDEIERLATENEIPELPKLRMIWRPERKPVTEGGALVRPALVVMEWGRYLTDEFVYMFPSLQNHAQKPIRAERETAYAKLITANTFQQLIITAKALVSPDITLISTVAGGITNYGNSYVTGVYRKFISNWLSQGNRSDPSTRWGKIRNRADQFTRTLLMSSFFTVQIYWMSRLFEWEKFSQIATLEGWRELGLAKFSSAVINVIWRDYYYQAILGFEKRMELKGRKEDGRRTASRFELLGTLIGTPAFLIASMQDPKAGWTLPLWGELSMQVTTAHLAMLGVGALFASFHYGVFKMEPWVERFDRIHARVLKAGRMVGLARFIDKTERTTRRAHPPLSEQAEYSGSGADFRPAPETVNTKLGATVIDLVRLDAQTAKTLTDQPELKKKISASSRLWKLFGSKSEDLPLRDSANHCEVMIRKSAQP
jgi:hypothetical protein